MTAFQPIPAPLAKSAMKSLHDQFNAVRQYNRTLDYLMLAGYINGLLGAYAISLDEHYRLHTLLRNARQHGPEATCPF